MTCSPWISLGARRRAALALAAMLLSVGSASAQVQVTVVDDDGQPITHGFRWLLEDDNTYGIKKTSPDGPWSGQAVTGAPQLPGTPSPTANWVPGAANPTHTLSVNVHRSHAPTVCAGDTQPLNQADCRGDPASCPKPVPGPATLRIDPTSCPGFSPTKNYFLSILPWHTDSGDGWMMSGRNIAAGQQTTTVVVHRYPQPTSQVTVLVFEDNQSINGAYDQPAETGLGEFTLILSDPAGQVLQDAFAFPVGTTYRYACTLGDGRPCKYDANGQQVPLLPEEQPEFQYDADGLPVVDFLGDGSIRTCPGPRGASGVQGYTAYQLANCVDPYTRTPLDRGEAVVRYLQMNKYALEPVPPPRGVDCGATRSQTNTIDCSDMLLTSTLEGSRQNDAWLRAGEPRYNIVLGSLNWLVFYGFVHPMNTLNRLPGPKTGRLTGRVVYVHDQHPPLSPGVSPGLPVPDCFVGLNNLSGNDEQVYTQPCAADSTFDIRNIPPGTYQLTMWDKSINAIIDFRTVTIAAAQAVDMGDVPVFSWFGKLQGHVFYDSGGRGFPPSGVPLDLSQDKGVPNVPINLHYTDGSIIQSTVTDGSGAFSFDYTAWWRFTVLEVGTGLGKPTGLTAVVDNGGALPANSAYGDIGIRPQRQPTGQFFRTESGDLVGSRRIAGPVTEAVNLFQDMTGYVAFGLANYDFSRGENGGIRGFIDYATTRTEEDPKTSAADGWEPGVPNVTVRLWKAKKDCTANPYGDCWVRDTSDTRFPQITKSDSWNDSIPTDCVSDPYGGGNLWPIPEVVNGFTIHPCAETFKNWDQTRAGVFDGAFSFDVLRDQNGNPLHDGAGNPVPLPPGNYLVEVERPNGYQVLFWGDRNIEFGDPRIPFLTKLPECVGALTPVPQFHTLYPDQQVPTDTSQAGVSWSANLSLPACDLKLVTLNPGATAAVSFNLFTMVPKAARIWGTVWNDLMLEFNPASPNASGNFAVPYIPVAIKDFKGTEVARFYTDQWGHFDGLVHTNYDIVPPIPLGLTLSMLTIAPNDPGPILDTRQGSPTSGQWITDPWFNPSFSRDVIRENWEFYPGRTTFIDTIVLPVGGFVGNRAPLNCAYTDKVPELRSVDKVIVSAGDVVTLTAKGNVNVPNPNFDPTATSGPNSQTLVVWDHSFGPPLPDSKVFINGTEVTNPTWAADGLTIRVTIPSVGGLPLTGQLEVQRGDNKARTTVGITLHPTGARVVAVAPPPANCSGLACGVIQQAVNSALPGTIILLSPGSYQEFVVLWKPVTLQGFGAGVTVFDGTAALSNLALKQRAFDLITTLEASGAIAAVPGQASNYTLETGAMVLVAGCGNTPSCGPPGSNTSFFAPGAVAQVDGIAATGSNEGGGGVVVNGFVANLKVTNTDIFGNQGNIGGAIRVGEPLVDSNFNPGLVVDHNRLAQNGSLFSGGGGLAFYAGTDAYRVTNNFICGNFSAVYGGGIGHFGRTLGLSIIQDNVIVSNESFDEGGGIHVGGEDTGAGGAALSPGAGNVLIDRNLIQGNKAGDDGGGFRSRRANGQDVAQNRTDPSKWFHIDISNNIIVNNSAADHGGGLSFDDTVGPTVINNTIARNDSTSTGSDAFGGPCAENDPVGQRCPAAEAIGGLTSSVPQVGGVASFAHSTPLLAALTGAGSYCATHAADSRCSSYPNPTLTSNIVWQNRSFFWDATANNNLGGLVLASAATASGPPLPGGYWDFAVYNVGGGATLSPTYSSLTNGIGATPNGTNQINRNPFPGAPVCTGAPAPGCIYFNVYQATSKGAALGNFVTVLFSPNGVQGNYHVPLTSPVVAAGGPLISTLQLFDIDKESRVAPVDMGADQTSAPRVGIAGVLSRFFSMFTSAWSWGSQKSSSDQPPPVVLTRRLQPPAQPDDATRGPIYKPTATGGMGFAAPDLTVSATVLDFGVVQRGRSSPPQLLTLTNRSSSPIDITRNLHGDDHFTTTIDDVMWSKGARTIPAHGTLTIQVSYAPGPGTALGARTLLGFQAVQTGASLHRVLLAGSAQ